MRRTIAWALVAAALGLSACSALEPPRDPSPEPTSSAARGGTLTVGITEPGPLDPLHVATRSARLVTGLLCDTMLVLDPVTGQAKPGIARKYVTATEGSTVTLLPLHEARFSDGSVLSSQDLNAGVTAMLEPVEVSPGLALAQPFVGGVLASQREAAAGQGQVQPLLVEEARRVLNPASP